MSGDNVIKPVLEPTFYTGDIVMIETLVLRNIQQQGYDAHKAGFLLRDCPPYLMQSWQRSWRAGWCWMLRSTSVSIMTISPV